LSSIDNEKLQQFMGKVLSDFGGAASLILAYIGDKFGLYKAMYDFGKPMSITPEYQDTRVLVTNGANGL
jgi:hypothetical protein